MAAAKVVLLLIAVLALAQANDWPFLDQIAVALVALLAVAWVWSRLSLRGVGLVRETATDRAQVGQPLTERLRVSNAGRLGKLWLEVRDYSTLPGHGASRVVHVGGRAAVRWRVETVCRRRGRFRIGPMAVRAGDPFGLFPTSLRVPGTHELVVYPATVDVGGFPLPPGALTGGAAVARRTPSVSASVAGVREYVPGDPFNRISWAATARTGRTMVKEFELEPTADVWVVLDLERDHHRVAAHPADHPGWRPPAAPWLDSTEEVAVTIAASLAGRCADEGRSFGLIASGGHYEVIPAERSDRQYLKVLETLAVIRADGLRPLAEVLIAEGRRFGRQSSVVVVTPSTDQAWVTALAPIAGRRVRAAVVVVEPETFGPAPSSLQVVSGLLGIGVPTHLVKCGDELGAALAAPQGLATAGGR